MYQEINWFGGNKLANVLVV